ncbi:phage portal protein [Succinimonas sp.]|uniref:phage portal protein n=1 Tax=Succinimonas sp. TaxID=1936151 RepID=UPI00386CA3C8
MSYGRREILTDTTEITTENVIAEVRAAFAVHSANRTEVDKLYKHYKGETAILGKTRETRPEINHKINENHAYEIVSFHKGYGFGEPIQYVRRENSFSDKPDDVIAADINALNGHMANAGKKACDQKLAEWMLIAGVGNRMALPNALWTPDGDEPPFRLYCLDPRDSFVVKSSGVERTPLFAVYYVRRRDGRVVFNVYTRNMFYRFVDGVNGLFSQPHALGMLPIVEYPADTARLGVFEIVMPLLDALNELQSNRMDDIVQFINSFLAILGAELNEETYKKLNDWKTLCLPEGTDAKYLSTALNQADIQTLKNDFYQAILTICGVPNRNGGTSTSDTGQAVELRDGWAAAEARAKATETAFEEPEREMLKLVLRIMRDTVGTSLKLSDIEPHFTRRNYENIATKSQVLIAMLNNPHIHPELAFQYCGMFSDPASAYLQSKTYYDEQMKKWEPVDVGADESADDEVGGDEGHV